MPFYTDIYVLCPARDAALAHRFLDELAPARTPSGEDAFSIDNLCAHPTESRSIYWQTGRDDGVDHVMLFFSEDGGMIVGISVDAGWEPDRDEIRSWLTRLAHSVGGRHGHVCNESPPIYDRVADFVADCKLWPLRLVDGVVESAT